MNKTALLIIDMQEDFCLPGAPFEVYGAMGVAKQIKQLLDSFRRHGLPVIHVFRYYRQDGSDVELTRYDGFMKVGGSLVRGEKGCEIVEQLRPIDGEYLVIKQRWSAFFQTELDLLLRRLGVDQVIVTGVQTPNCIRGTVWDANSLDYEVIVPTDGTGAKTMEVHEANLFDMKNIGIKIMTTDELIATIPNNIPRDNHVEKIRLEIAGNRTIPEKSSY